MLAARISRVAELFAVSSGMVEQMVNDDVAVRKGGCDERESKRGLFPLSKPLRPLFYTMHGSPWTNMNLV